MGVLLAYLVGGWVWVGVGVCVWEGGEAEYSESPIERWRSRIHRVTNVKRIGTLLLAGVRVNW